MLNNQVIILEYVLNTKYITVDKVYNDYHDLLIRKSK